RLFYSMLLIVCESHFIPFSVIHGNVCIILPLIQQVVISILLSLGYDIFFLCVCSLPVQNTVHSHYKVGVFSFYYFSVYLSVLKGFCCFFQFVIQEGVVISKSVVHSV